MPAIDATGSLTLTLVSTAAPILPTVIRTRDTPPVLTGLVRKVLTAVSAGVYCRVAFAATVLATTVALPALPVALDAGMLAVTPPTGMMLSCTVGAPTVPPSTSTWITQVPATPLPKLRAAIVPLASETDPAPGTAVTAPPLQVVDALGGLAITILPGEVGRVSVRATLLSAV